MDFDPVDPRNLIHARPPEFGKIFVSSKRKGDTLKVERCAAIEAIQEFPLTEPWAWEVSAAAGPYCSERECAAQAGTSDGLVLILADDITPVTRSELDAAQGAGVPIFVMLKTGVTRDGVRSRDDRSGAPAPANGVTGALAQHFPACRRPRAPELLGRG